MNQVVRDVLKGYFKGGGSQREGMSHCHVAYTNQLGMGVKRL